MCKVFTGRKFIRIKDTYHECHLYLDTENLIDEHAYIMGDYVFIYKKDSHCYEDLMEGEFTILKKNKTKTLVKKEIEKNSVREEHDIGNIFDTSASSTFDSVEEDNYRSEEMTKIITSNGEIFTPEIKPQDDFLKFLIKKAILDKKISLKDYREKFGSQNNLNNLKSSLIHDTKMSVTYFQIWLEVLGLKVSITLEDDGTDLNAPLSGPIHFDENTSIE